MIREAPRLPRPGSRQRNFRSPRAPEMRSPASGRSMRCICSARYSSSEISACPCLVKAGVSISSTGKYTSKAYRRQWRTPWNIAAAGFPSTRSYASDRLLLSSPDCTDNHSRAPRRRRATSRPTPPHFQIIRHASAEERSAFAATGKSNDRRPLTDEGRRKMTEAAEGLRALVPHLDVIAASPLVRAQQTAVDAHEPHLGTLVTWLL